MPREKGKGWVPPSQRQWTNEEALQHAQQLKNDGYHYKGEVYGEDNQPEEDLIFRQLAQDHPWAWGYLEVSPRSPYPERGADVSVLHNLPRPKSEEAADIVEQLRSGTARTRTPAHLARLVIAAMGRSISMADLGIADDDELLWILNTADEDGEYIGEEVD